MSETTEIPVYTMPGGHPVTVFLHGLITRPVEDTPLTREELILFLRDSLSRRIQTGSWSE